jgi:hypothetical protein
VVSAVAVAMQPSPNFAFLDKPHQRIEVDKPPGAPFRVSVFE